MCSHTATDVPGKVIIGECATGRPHLKNNPCDVRCNFGSVTETRWRILWIDRYISLSLQDSPSHPHVYINSRGD